MNIVYPHTYVGVAFVSYTNRVACLTRTLLRGAQRSKCGIVCSPAGAAVTHTDMVPDSASGLLLCLLLCLCCQSPLYPALYGLWRWQRQPEAEP